MLSCTMPISSGVTGLKGTEFARSNLTGAKLPQGIRDFSILSSVNDVSANAQKVFLSMLVACAYCWLTIATTSDARLLTNSTSSPLPLIQTAVPLAGFYLTAPLLLLCIFLWLHLYLQDMWRGLAGLPAVFPDGRPLDEKVNPWLLTGFVRSHFKLLRDVPPALSSVKKGLSISLAWWLVPGTLASFWLRYLSRHDWLGTAIHICLLMVALTSAAALQHLARRTLSEDPDDRGDRVLEFPRRDRDQALRSEPIVDDDSPGTSERRANSTGRWALRFATVALPVLVMLVVISDGAINGTPRNGRRALTTPDWTHRQFVPELLSQVGAGAFANLVEADVSVRPENWFLAPAVAPRDAISGATLRGADLRYANAEGAFMAKAIMRGASMDGINLRNANLEEADLHQAALRGAILDGANLTRAILRGSDLRETNGLTQAQLDSACADEHTRIPAHLTVVPNSCAPRAR